LSKDSLDAIFVVSMLRLQKINLPQGVILLVLFLVSLVSCLRLTAAQTTTHNPVVVELVPIDVDPKHPERRNFGSLTLLSAFQIESKDKRFGGLSGLSIAANGKLYGVSDRGYWLSAKMEMDPNGVLLNLTDWQIAPILTTTNTPVTGALRDAEALAVAQDGSFLVAFEGTHRIWRYSPPPKTFESTPVSVQIPAAVARAPGNGGIEGLAMLPDGRLLALTEEFANGDGSFKGWLIDKGQFAELAYFPAKGFRVTDCAGLNNGDVLVLERRYVPFGILSARLTLVKANSLQPGAKLTGQELLKLEQPLAVQNFEAVATQQTSKGTMIYIVSDDNYSPFQQTLIMQFLLPNTDN
jgi:hypothetical protein